MNREEFALNPGRPLAILIAVMILAGSASAAGPLLVIHRFQGASDGENPAGNLIADKAGNLYGTTEYGGVSGYYGTVFQLAPPAQPGDGWTETTLYTFRNQGDGARPTAGLVFDSAGNLYGTTSDSNAGGYGEIFQLAPPSTKGGSWTETVLYHFQGGTDGAYPYGGLIFDPAGNLYGTTESSVFELSPPTAPAGIWTFTLIHDFTCCTSDGWNSVAGLVRDPQGNLYGTTEWGGAYTGVYCDYLGCGTVFEVSPPSAQGGAWSEKVLYAFGGQPDGLNPFSGLALDQAGNLYGTTYGGGIFEGGMAFQLAPPAQPGAPWTETVIHNFSYSAKDGAVPLGTLIFGPSGNLYGTTAFGGNPCVFNTTAYGCGVVFQLAPPSTQGAAWTETLLYLFTTFAFGPREPVAGLTFGQAGNLYGATAYGGYDGCSEEGLGCGTVFKISR
ncbi:MAG TPA: choice-of-anchor tandem repeat GloVer-containing protein [Terriglobia bacterium]